MGHEKVKNKMKFDYVRRKEREREAAVRQGDVSERDRQLHRRVGDSALKKTNGKKGS